MRQAIPFLEAPTVEVVSDRWRLPDAELVEAVVSLANATVASCGWVRQATARLPACHLVTGLGDMVVARTSPSRGALRERNQLGVEGSDERIQRDADSAKRTLEALSDAGFVDAHAATRGSVKRAKARELCRLSEGQVKNLLKRMCGAGLLVWEGAVPAAHYRIGSSDRVVLDEIG